MDKAKSMLQKILHVVTVGLLTRVLHSLFVKYRKSISANDENEILFLGKTHVVNASLSPLKNCPIRFRRGVYTLRSSLHF